MKIKKPKFLRRSSSRYSRLGKLKKKKQKWNKPKGRDNKMREKRRGYPTVVSIGYGSENRKTEIVVRNLNDLKKLKDKDEIVMGKIGRKKKMELIKMAQEKKIVVKNINVKRFLKKKKIIVKTGKISAEEAKKILEEKKKDSKEKSK